MKTGNLSESKMNTDGTSQSFKTHQRKDIFFNSKEFKDKEKRRREEMERDYQDNKPEGDNLANDGENKSGWEPDGFERNE